MCSGMGIRQNLLIPTSSGRAAACATNVAFGMGIHYCLGASPSGAMKPPVSPNASWTVFRVQTERITPESRPPYIFSNVLPELWPPHF